MVTPSLASRAAPARGAHACGSAYGYTFSSLSCCSCQMRSPRAPMITPSLAYRAAPAKCAHACGSAYGYTFSSLSCCSCQMRSTSSSRSSYARRQVLRQAASTAARYDSSVLWSLAQSGGCVAR